MWNVIETRKGLATFPLFTLFSPLRRLSFFILLTLFFSNPQPDTLSLFFSNTHRLPIFPSVGFTFPKQVVKLHIFEHRYRDMVNRALNTTREFIMIDEEALDVPARATNDDGSVAVIRDVLRVGCVVKIERAHSFPDGRSVITVEGTHRVELKEVREDDSMFGKFFFFFFCFSFFFLRPFAFLSSVSHTPFPFPLSLPPRYHCCRTLLGAVDPLWTATVVPYNDDEDETEQKSAGGGDDEKKGEEEGDDAGLLPPSPSTTTEQVAALIKGRYRELLRSGPSTIETVDLPSDAGQLSLTIPQISGIPRRLQKLVIQSRS